jgi:hypothetical protein
MPEMAVAVSVPLGALQAVNHFASYTNFNTELDFTVKVDIFRNGIVR